MTSPGVAKAKKEQHQFKSLKDELARLGTQIESAKRRLESYQFDQAEHDRLVEVLKDLATKKAALTEEVAALEARKALTTRELAEIEPKLNTLKAELKEHTEINDRTKGNLTQAGRELEVAKSDTEAHRAGTVESTRQTLSDIHKDVETARNTLRDLNNAISEARAESEALGPNRTKHKELMKQISKSQEDLNGIEASIKARGRDKKKAEEDLAAVNQEIEQKRKDFEEECTKRTTALNLREKDLSNREGDVNFLKENLIKKAGLLRDAKHELEQFHGKPLRHIVIPTIEDVE